SDAERQDYINLANSLVQVKIDAWTISDIDLISVGGFSPLTGFLDETDYNSVVDHMRLSNGTVWSIPVTLAVDEKTAKQIKPGQQVALVGEADHVLYAIIDVSDIYKPNKLNEASQVFKTKE